MIPKDLKKLKELKEKLKMKKKRKIVEDDLKLLTNNISNYLEYMFNIFNNELNIIKDDISSLKLDVSRMEKIDNLRQRCIQPNPFSDNYIKIPIENQEEIDSKTSDWFEKVGNTITIDTKEFALSTILEIYDVIYKYVTEEVVNSIDWNHIIVIQDDTLKSYTSSFNELYNTVPNTVNRKKFLRENIIQSIVNILFNIKNENEEEDK